MSIPVVQDVLDVMDAYIQQFHPPMSSSFLQQIIEAVLPTLDQRSLSRDQVKHLTQEAMRQFNPLIALNKAIDPEAKSLATKVDQQIRNFQPERGVAEALNILDAYIQQYKPPMTRSFLYPVVKTILPQIKGLKLTEDRLNQLANQAIVKFSPEVALTKVFNPEVAAIAGQVARQVQNFQPEQITSGVLNVMDAYVQSNTNSTEQLLYQVAKTVISKMVNLPLNSEAAEQFTAQVMFKFNTRPAPIKPPDQAAREMAAQLTAEVNQFRSNQAKLLNSTVANKPTTFGDLSVGINIIKKS